MDRRYGYRVLGCRWCRSLRSRLRRGPRRIVERVVVYENPGAVDVADIQVVIVVECYCERRRAKVVQKGVGERVRAKRVVIDPHKSGANVAVVPRYHPVGTVERDLPGGRQQGQIALPKNCSALLRVRPQVVAAHGGTDEDL